MTGPPDVHNVGQEAKETVMSASVSVGIVVGVDDSPASDAAVGWATRNAIERRLPLTLVHAIVARR